MAGLGDLFGKGSIGEQLFVWGLLSQVVQALTAPGVTELGYASNSTFPNQVLPPAELAELVARTLNDPGSAANDAQKAGISNDRFDKLVKGATHAPDLGAVITAFQRKLIGSGVQDGNDVSLFGALTDAGIRQGWHSVLEALAVQIPTVAEVMNAWLEGQISEEEARTRYLAAGGDPTWFQTSYNANGEAPTPVQALELWNRGIIPENGTGPDAVSYEQAFLEGPWRNKWLPAFKALREYLPPPRTVTAMYHQGQLTHDRAAELLIKQGLAPDLAAAYLSPSSGHAATTEKTLAKTDITALYGDGLMSKTDALAALEALKYTAHDAALILELIDVRINAQQVTAGVSRTRTLFAAGKLTEAQARTALTDLGVAATQAAGIVDTWAVTGATEVRSLTAAQIEAAWFYQLISTTDALDQLVSIGYDALDAWLLLSIRNKGPLTDVPRPK